MSGANYIPFVAVLKNWAYEKPTEPDYCYLIGVK